MSAGTPSPEELGPERAQAIRKLLAEARRALEFDRAHLVVVGDGDCARYLPQMLAAELAGEIETVRLRLDGPEPDLEARVEAAVREARSSVSPPASGGPDPMAPRRARQVLLLPDALDIPAETLRGLSELASRSDMTRRLALFVDRDASGIGDPARELVGRLGAGVSKVEIDPAEPRRIPTERIAPPEPSPALMGPPVVERPRGRRFRPVSVGAGRGGSLARRVGAWLATGALAGTAAVMAAPAIVSHAPRLPELVEAPSTTVLAAATGQAAALPARGSAGSTPSSGSTAPPRPQPAGSEPEPELREVEPAPASGLPPVGVPKAEPATAQPSGVLAPAKPPTTPEPTAPATARPEPEPATPAEPAEARPIAVSFNADPWADLVIDGRPIGPTPIANVSLARGEHRLRATFPDGRVVERRIRVDSLRNRFRID